MNQHENVIGELNRFLRGRYMGMLQYEHLIEKAKAERMDERLLDMLERFREHARLGAERISQRIKQLGGEPVDGIGIMGHVQDWMQKLRGYPETPEGILRDAFMGENKYGIKMSHLMVAGELDPESKKIVDTILEEDQKRADQIKQCLGQGELV